MRQLYLFLLLVFSFSSLQAQISITKRKHRGGYHIETNFKRNKVSKLTKVKTSDIEKINPSEAFQNNTLTKITHKSALHTLTASAFEAQIKLPVVPENKVFAALKPIKYRAKNFYIPHGAALHKISKKQNKTAFFKQSNSAGSVLAVLGFICGLLSFIFLFIGGLGLIFVLPGIVFSLFGLGSEYHIFALVGLIISFLTLLLALLLLSFFLSLFSLAA